MEFPNELWQRIVDKLSYKARKSLITLNKNFSALISNSWYSCEIELASFDIGKNNFAQYVEVFNLGELMNCSQKYFGLSGKERRKTKGKVTPEIKNLLDRVYLSGRRKEIGVFDFQENFGGNRKLDNATRKELIKHLSSYSHLWRTCDIVIVEQQYTNRFGAKSGINMDAINMGEGLKMWFLDHYPEIAVLTFGSQYKTQILGAPYGLTKPQRKKWATEKTLEIFKMRNDQQAIMLYELREKILRKRMNTEEKIQSYLIEFSGCQEDIIYMANRILRFKQKLDDISDVVVQAQAYKYRIFVAKF
jgi:hypothetical protein